MKYIFLCLILLLTVLVNEYIALPIPIVSMSSSNTYSQIHVYPGMNLTDIIVNAKPYTEIVVHKGTYEASLYIVNKHHLRIRSYDGEVHIRYNRFLVNSSMYIEICIMGDIEPLYSPGDIVIDNSTSITLCNATLASNGSRIIVNNSHIISLRGMHIENFTIEIMGDSGDISIVGNNLTNVLVNIYSGNLENVLVSTNNFFYISNYMDKYVVEIKPHIGGGGTVSYYNITIANNNYGLLKSVNESECITSFLLANVSGYETVSLEHINISYNRGYYPLSSINNVYCPIAHLIEVVSSMEKLVINNTYIVGNYIVPYINMTFIEIVYNGYSGTEIYLNNTYIVANTVKGCKAFVEGFKGFVIDIDSPIDQDNISLNIYSLYFYGNIVDDAVFYPSFGEDFLKEYSNVYFYSPRKIMYWYNGRIYRSYMGNYLAVFRYLNGSYVDRDSNGIAENHTVYGIYNDPYPIYYEVRSTIDLWIDNESYFYIEIQGYRHYYVFSEGERSIMMIVPVPYMILYELPDPIDRGRLSIGTFMVSVYIHSIAYENIRVVSNLPIANYSIGDKWINVSLYNYAIGAIIVVYTREFIPVKVYIDYVEAEPNRYNYTYPILYVRSLKSLSIEITSVGTSIPVGEYRYMPLVTLLILLIMVFILGSRRYRRSCI